MNQLSNTSLIVLGMHRNGTSAIAGLLSKLGVELGHRLLPPAEENPHGFWEHPEIVACHDRLLSAFGSSWSDPFSLPPKWWSQPPAAACRSELEIILRRDFSDRPLFCVKDPRMSRLLPMWKPLLHDLGCDVRYLIICRHPWECAQSLTKRNGFPEAKSYLLWLDHVVAAESDTRDSKRAFLLFDELLDNPRQAIHRLGKNLEITWPRGNNRDLNEAEAFLFPKARHHRASDNIDLPTPVKNAYEAIQKAARGELSAMELAMDQVHSLTRDCEFIFASSNDHRLALQNRLDVTSSEFQQLETQHQRTEVARRQLETEYQSMKAEYRGLETGYRRLEADYRQQQAQYRGKAEKLKQKVAREKAKRDKTSAKLDALWVDLEFFRSSWAWSFSKPVRLLEKALSRGSTLPHRTKSTNRTEASPEESPVDLKQENYTTDLSPVHPSPEIDTEKRNPKVYYSDSNHSALRNFLSSGQKLKFQSPAEPEVSVLLVLYNRAELTYGCLRSLSLLDPSLFELIIVDNASFDETTELLERIEGATIIRNAKNEHFLGGANKASSAATGKRLLFLNNDAQLLPGAVEAAMDCLSSSGDIGAVGAKQILLDGSLQEAGSIVWSDGSCAGYGRGSDPAAPEFQYRRDVDFCSGSFLLTPRSLFEELGGFSEDFKPAYYEEVDYCIRLQEAGMRVVYEPKSAILHYEFGSSETPEDAFALQVKNREVFVRAHQSRLQNHCPPSEQDFLTARSLPRTSKRVLFIDDRVPHEHLGSGFPRAVTIIRALRELGCTVTLYPYESSPSEWPSVYTDIPNEVEVMIGFGRDRLDEFLIARADFYDVIIVSRPHNMRHFQPLIVHPGVASAKVIYDAEAVEALRTAGKAKLEGRPLKKDAIETLISEEIELTRGSKGLISVNEFEAELLSEKSGLPCTVVGHTLAPKPSKRPHSDRRGLLFVGAIHEEGSPNEDSILWFVREVFPLIRARSPLELNVIGINNSSRVAALDSKDEGVKIIGMVPDLEEAYHQARVFIAPTRFAAGIPHKICAAASSGLPVVATSLLAEQLQWKDEEELLVADTPELFAEKCIELHENSDLWHRLSENGITAVKRDYSWERFVNGVRKAIE